MLSWLPTPPSHISILHSPCPTTDQIYGGSRQEVLYRCALLSKAALEAPRLLPGGEEGPLGEGCVFVANDFHAALVPVYLQVRVVIECLLCGRGCWSAEMYLCGQRLPCSAGASVPAGEGCAGRSILLGWHEKV